jgi:hypothetical protein
LVSDLKESIIQTLKRREHSTVEMGRVRVRLRERPMCLLNATELIESFVHSFVETETNAAVFVFDAKTKDSPPNSNTSTIYTKE